MSAVLKSVDVVKLRHDAGQTLSDVASKLAELNFALVSSADGRLLASWFASDRDGNRLSAIVSSLLAICETAGRELKAGACRSAIVVAEHLHIVVTRIEALERSLVVATAFSQELMLGGCLRHTYDLSEKVRLALQASAAPTAP